MAIPRLPDSPQACETEESAYRLFRIRLFNAAVSRGQILAHTATGLEAWLTDPAREQWASTTPMTGCTHRPDAHSLLACLLDEIRAYREQQPVG